MFSFLQENKTKAGCLSLLNIPNLGKFDLQAKLDTRGQVLISKILKS